MPRKARIDAPGALHHIIFRGIERRKIFRDNKDRDNFLDRLGKVMSVSLVMGTTLTKFLKRRMSSWKAVTFWQALGMT
jgi:hypothetical protein